MYLKVVNGTKSKEYTLTSQYNEKPYMIVSGANKLPLTTKPPLNQITSSESGTFYTTAENSENLSETTALTRQSTYETVYETRASTSNTIYGTRNDAVLWSASASDYYAGTTYRTSVTNITRYNNNSLYGNPLKVTYDENNYWNTNTYNSYAIYYNTGITPTGYKTVTTGTTYLTRVSTSGTLYLTISSTSKYAGISSSSSSSSYISGNIKAYLKIVNGIKTYRPLEYRLSSESASMYTTVNVNDWYLLSNTTALTRASTSQTVYNTRASTYNTLYGTRKDTSQWSASKWYGDDGIWVQNITRINGITVYGNPLYMTAPARFTMASYAFYHGWDALVPTGYKTVTTGTTYQTRASTYQTIYQTRESTSAYSGVSSSSQSAMVWV